MTNQQQRKQVIRRFMRDHYTDERLAQLLAHAQDGKLRYESCCCFIGIPTADHALLSVMLGDHSKTARETLSGAVEAEDAFLYLDIKPDGNEKRRRILIPMIRAEQRRRALTIESQEPFEPKESGEVKAERVEQ